MKYLHKIGILAIVLSIVLAQTPVYAAMQEGSVHGRYEFNDCRSKHYTGTGTMRIESIPEEYGYPGFVVLWGDTNKVAKQIKAMEGSVQVSANSDYNMTYIVFGEDGGAVHLSGTLDITAFGAWLDVAARGSFDYSMGPNCTWES